MHIISERKNSAKKREALEKSKASSLLYVSIGWKRIKKLFEPDYYHKISRLIKPQSEKEKKVVWFLLWNLRCYIGRVERKNQPIELPSWWKILRWNYYWTVFWFWFDARSFLEIVKPQRDRRISETCFGNILEFWSETWDAS